MSETVATVQVDLELSVAGALSTLAGEMSAGAAPAAAGFESGFNPDLTAAVAAGLAAATAAVGDSAGTATAGFEAGFTPELAPAVGAGLASSGAEGGGAGAAAAGEFETAFAPNLGAGVADSLTPVTASAAVAGGNSGEAFADGFGKSAESVQGTLVDMLSSGSVLAAVGISAGLTSFAEVADRVVTTGRQTAAVIASTGAAAGVTAEHVAALASSIREQDAVSGLAVKSAENLLLTFTNVRNGVGEGTDIFDQGTQAIVDMAAAMNRGNVTAESLRSTTIQVGKALQDPIAGATALRRVGVQLDDQQKAQIKTFIDMGETAKAQAIVLHELQKEFGGSAEAYATPLRRMEVAMGSLRVQVGTALLPLLDTIASTVSNRIAPAVGSLFSAIGRLPTPVVIGFAAALAGAAASSKILALGTTIAAVAGKAFSTVTAIAGAAAAGAGEAMVAGGAGAGVLSTGLLAARGAATGAATAMGILDVSLGPVGIALAVAAGAIALFSSSAGDAKDKTAGAADAMRQWGDALKDGVTPASAQAADQIIRQNEGLQDLAVFAVNAGISTERLADGLRGEAQARIDILASFRAQIAALRTQASEARNGADADTAQSKALTSKADALEKLQHEFAKVNTAQAAAQAASAAVSGSMATATTRTMAWDEALAALSANTETLASKTATAADKEKALKAAMDAIYVPLQNQNEAIEAQIRARDALSTAMREGGTQFDLNKAKTIEARNTTLGLRDALEASLKSTQEEFQANVVAGMAIGEATKRHDEEVASLLNLIPKTERQSVVVQDLAAKYGGIPRSVETTITTPGIDAVLENLRNVKIAQYAIDNNMTIGAAQEALSNSQGNWGRQFGHAFAEGGRVSGPGGPTSDSVPMWGSDGEHVWTAAEVAGAGGHGVMEQMRALARDRMLTPTTGGASVANHSATTINLTTSARGGEQTADLLRQLAWVTA